MEACKSDEKKSRLLPWQIEEVKKGILEAERGEFVSQEEVEAMWAEWLR